MEEEGDKDTDKASPKKCCVNWKFKKKNIDNKKIKLLVIVENKEYDIVLKEISHNSAEIFSEILSFMVHSYNHHESFQQSNHVFL